MKPPIRSTLSVATLAALALSGAVYAAPDRAGQAGQVTIDPATGAMTDANGGITTLPAGSIIVLPSPGATTVGAGGAISGVIVPADSAQVAAILTAFAGSSTNFNNLQTGLRNRSSITLTSAASGSATFVPPGRPLSPIDTTQALLLSLSQLNALGIAQPAPQQIQASLVGGNIAAVSGQTVAVPGVLQLRSQGFNFVQIAQAIGSQTAGVAPGTQPTLPAATGPRDRVPPGSIAAGARAGIKSDAGTSSSASSANTGASTGAGTAGGGTTQAPSGSREGANAARR